MWKWILGAAIPLCLGGAMVLLLRNPTGRPYIEISPSRFQSLDELGEAVVRRLWPSMHASQLLLLGDSPRLAGSAMIWGGVIKTAQKRSLPYTLLLEQEGLEPMEPIGSLKRVVYRMDNLSPVLELAGATLAQGGRVVIRATASLVSRLDPNGLPPLADRIWSARSLALISQPFVGRRQDLNQLSPSCDAVRTAKGVASVSAKLNCRAEYFSRLFFRKNLAPETLWGGLEMIGREEHLVFVLAP